jgi:(p)ppGpp synthase/HD superfamily hydrolase
MGVSAVPAHLQFYDCMEYEDVTETFLWGRLEPRLDYLTDADRATVKRALSVAIHAHEGQIRKSGEPFVTHPVEVTRILAELQAERVRFLAPYAHATVGPRLEPRKVLKQDAAV